MQAVFDDLINSQTDYKAEIEADGNFEQDVQIRAQAGTLDVILLPQPGAVIEQAKVGQRRLARGHGLQHRRSERDVR